MKNNEKVIKTEVVDAKTIKEIFENGCYRIVWYYDKEYTKKYSIQYYNLKGNCHRENDLPSITYYLNDGNVESKMWLQNDKQRRLEGPAVIRYNINRKVKSEQYWIDNELLTKEEFENHPERILYKNLKLFS